MLDYDALMRRLGVQIKRQRAGLPMTVMFCANCLMWPDGRAGDKWGGGVYSRWASPNNELLNAK